MKFECTAIVELLVEKCPHLINTMTSGECGCETPMDAAACAGRLYYLQLMAEQSSSQVSIPVMMIALPLTNSHIDV